MSEFKVGDKVRVLTGVEGVVTYGPFSSTFDTYKMYVVKQDGDDERAFKSADLEPLPKFAVGDKVMAASGVNEYTLHAGPFNGGLGGHFWVLERPDGAHVWAHADSLTKVEAPALVPVGTPVTEPADGFEYEGIVYEYGALYRDREGDLFRFRSTLSGDGTPQGQAVFGPEDDEGDTWHWSLAEVLSDYAPLIKQH